MAELPDMMPLMDPGAAGQPGADGRRLVNLVGWMSWIYFEECVPLCDVEAAYTPPWQEAPCADGCDIPVISDEVWLAMLRAGRLRLALADRRSGTRVVRVGRQFVGYAALPEARPDARVRQYRVLRQRWHETAGSPEELTVEATSVPAAYAKLASRYDEEWCFDDFQVVSPERPFALPPNILRLIYAAGRASESE